MDLVGSLPVVVGVVGWLTTAVLIVRADRPRRFSDWAFAAFASAFFGAAVAAATWLVARIASEGASFALCFAAGAAMLVYAWVGAVFAGWELQSNDPLAKRLRSAGLSFVFWPVLVAMMAVAFRDN